PSPALARPTRSLAAATARSSPARFAVRTPDLPRPRCDFNFATTSGGSDGSVRRHRRPLITSQRSSSSGVDPARGPLTAPENMARSSDSGPAPEELRDVGTALLRALPRHEVPCPLVDHPARARDRSRERLVILRWHELVALASQNEGWASNLSRN